MSVSSVEFVSSLSLPRSPLVSVATGLTGVTEIVDVPMEVVEGVVVPTAVVGVPAEVSSPFRSRHRLKRTPPPPPPPPQPVYRHKG